jgi:carbamoyltransferase
LTPPIYVLGTGLSHNGSAVLLKNGRICVGIEKERISRKKHDGGNDSLAIQYCLDAEGIELSDVALVVQCANFDIPERNQFRGERLFAAANEPTIIDISHHLAHAYSAVGTSPFDECAVMVIDGCGSPIDQFLKMHPEQKKNIDTSFLNEKQMICEKDSFYHFDGQKLTPLFKDFSKMSEVAASELKLPTTQHSIGGFYAAVSFYVFGDMDDVGKLMGLAPFGDANNLDFEAFEFQSGCLLVKENWKKHFTNPSKGYDYFKEHFSYYANIAKWAQEQVEKAVISCIANRMEIFPHKNLCYTGGVALNAVANAKLEDAKLARNIYFEPAAGDNGLALGCAYYGWLDYLKMPKVTHDGSTCFGKQYSEKQIDEAIEKETNENYIQKKFENEESLILYSAKKLNEGKTIAWFQSGSEFGPRSLGRRSILAHPGIGGMKAHINANIKFREDFRPFAPAVLKEKARSYFESGRNSPYMILVDKTRPEYLKQLCNVTHCDGSARVQTVEETWNPRFAKLLKEFEKQSGIAVLLNTSLNKKGMPIVETPEEALYLFGISALDILVLENTVVEKNKA